MFSYPDSAIRFIQTHFYQPQKFHVDTVLNKNIIKELLPERITSFLEAYKQLMHCFLLTRFPQVLDECRIQVQCGIRNQLDVTQYYIYYSFISCSTFFGPPCAHLQELKTQWYFFTCGVVPWLCRQSDPSGWLCVHWEVRSTNYKEQLLQEK